MFAVNHLIGFGGFTAVAAGPTSMAFHDVAYTSTDTATMPAGSIAGDLIIFADLAINTSTEIALVTPTDFTNWINQADVLNEARYAVSYKIADGTETTITGMNADLDNDKILAVFRPDIPITTITASTPVTQATAGNPTAQNVNADGAGTLPLIVFGFYSSPFLDVVNPRTMSPAATAELVNSGDSTNYHYLKYQLQNVALADVSVDMDDEGASNLLASGFLWFA